ncbi:hypothetical protein FE257_001543 [Aspergillus nanangensis]|uniref:AB hydrolase-1 domain-containing protein n=1 Tax=Aspergillus nanangensis TaxID=2582783 RepID=A0AAD4GX85_ASPNN|nr:hypothetical protein FE257_001543 [Aspergillus nanangensis]
MADVDKINVCGDPRVERRSAQVNGKTYSYLYSVPDSGQYRATIFLIHGFPDLAMAWRYQIPMLRNIGLRVVVPDCLGYGQTDAPEEIEPYSNKNCANDIKELASQLGASKIIVGGHDWGAYLAYRVALWHPELVTHVFTVCVPYSAPSKTYMSINEMVAKITPHFGYQLQFIKGDLEKPCRSKEELKLFLSTLYGGRTAEREVAFNVHDGVLLDKMYNVLPSKLLTEEELDFYATEFARSGLHGPFNWYRTRKVNYEDELAILDQRITAPVLFIQALRDAALPPHLVDTAHWALWERPKEVNDHIAWWLEEVVFKDPRMLKL